MVSNLLRCCFPVTKESIITINEFKSIDNENDNNDNKNKPLNIKAIQITNDIKLNGQSADNKKSLISLEQQGNTERTSDFNRNLINNLEQREDSLIQHKSSIEIKSSFNKDNAVSLSVSIK
jgi:hypothetical protein